ncbi:hypothetical protein [Rhizobium sp. BK176]|uniref:hypothetical protein n=1 Tax=Rhizobium sp. BK176 TaxID=2587071 RepID=UPI0021682FCE|nr:hypothetical protein [Rhizobium sp. BK176]MCS4089262.1 hypothetical protein [Rhizobium sp. BK176]
MNSQDVRTTFGLRRMELGFISLMLLTAAGLIVWYISWNLDAFFAVVVLSVGLPALFYGFGYVAEKAYILTPQGRVAAAKFDAEVENRRYAEAVPRVCVMTHKSASGDYTGTVSVMGEPSKPDFSVTAIDLDELVDQAKKIAADNGANALCVFNQDSNSVITYLKKVETRDWVESWNEENGKGLAEFRQRAACNQCLHDGKTFKIGV